MDLDIVEDDKFLFSKKREKKSIPIIELWWILLHDWLVELVYQHHQLQEFRYENDRFHDEHVMLYLHLDLIRFPNLFVFVAFPLRKKSINEKMKFDI
jgi:hypothetical protein